MAGGPALLKKRPLVLGAVALVLALALAALLVTKPWAGTKSRDDVAAPAAGDRVLQSVEVTAQGDGSLTRVGDTVVIARASGGQADSYSTAYDPTKVVDQLPVRILTSYQTDKGSGTDLDDLQGYSGRVAISLSVQNLTVRPQEITYDSAGRSRTTTAQVGAPLTVVASAALPGIDPATVVTAGTDATTAAAEDTGSTNGVLSRSQDGTTQVQWASILAPPQLSPTATFRVVLDAKDLVVPTLDVSVQPGLVTDPSVGALIDSAFNPKNSSELALETRTIKLVGDVNDVLGRASSTISGVRKTLDASSETLGTKTVQSLTEDTKTIGTSLKSSSDAIDSLSADLKGSLTTTQSATLQRMSATVSGLQDLIGDTSAAPPKLVETGTGCATSYRLADAKGGVYANLQGVVAQLNAYATTTEACKKDLQASLTSNLGTADEAAGKQPCTSGSVVCSLRAAQEKLSGAVQDVTRNLAGAPEDAARVQTAASDLDEVAGRLAPIVDRLSGDKASTSAGRELQEGVDGDQLAAISRQLRAIIGSPSDEQPPTQPTPTSLGGISADLKALSRDARENGNTLEDMTAQNDALAKELCTFVGDATTPSKLSQDDVSKLRGYLTSDACDGSDAEPVAPAGYSAPLNVRLSEQRGTWVQLEKDATDLAADLDDRIAAIEEIAASLERAQDALSGVRLSINKLRAERDKIASLSDLVAAAQANYKEAEDLSARLKNASDAADELQAPDLTKQIEQVATQGQESSEELGSAFDDSSKGLAAAADALRDGSAKTLQRQREVVDEQAQVKDDVAARTEAGLSQVSRSITSATRDIDSTRTRLTADLDNVLLDLGNPDQPGKGLLGTLGKSARAADSADYQLGLASDTVSSYSSVRGREVDGILLRQAQAEAALQRQAELPAFATELPSNVQHRTVYLFHLGGDR